MALWLMTHWRTGVSTSVLPTLLARWNLGIRNRIKSRFQRPKHRISRVVL